jgi:hypothetical protein
MVEIGGKPLVPYHEDIFGACQGSGDVPGVVKAALEVVAGNN